MWTKKTTEKDKHHPRRAKDIGSGHCVLSAAPFWPIYGFMHMDTNWSNLGGLGTGRKRRNKGDKKNRQEQGQALAYIITLASL